MQPTVWFDCVAGELTAKLLEKMPMEWEYFIYGGLSNQNTTLNCPSLFLIGRKQLKGIWLSYQLPQLDPKKKAEFLDFIFNDIKKGGEKSIFKTNVLKYFKL